MYDKFEKIIRKKPRCFKLHICKQAFMTGLLNNDFWANFPIAPPA